MTPAYLAARVEVRERRALADYRLARALYFGHRWSDAHRRAMARARVLHCRAMWSVLHDLMRQPSRAEQIAGGIDVVELGLMAGANQDAGGIPIGPWK